MYMSRTTKTEMGTDNATLGTPASCFYITFLIIHIQRITPMIISMKCMLALFDLSYATH